MERTYDTEIISVGTEILLGHITNTDSRDISEQLSKIGINVRYHTVVGDNPQRLEKCIQVALSRADIIITTGGLGPTCDDLTKQIVAKAFDLPLVKNDDEEKALLEYTSTHKTVSKNNFNQALLPEGCTVFHNTCGTAPGCAIEKDGKIAIMLPGPPKECHAMFVTSAMPFLKKLSDEKIVSHSVHVFGKGEAEVDAMFAEEMNAMTNPTMAPYAKESDCLLQITAKAKTEQQAEEMIKPVMEHVMERLGEYVYGVDVECVEEAVIKMLSAQGKSFSVAEDFTGGEIAQRFTNIPDAAKVFPGGIVCCNRASKEKILGIDSTLLEKEGDVSADLTAQMAKNVRELMGTDFGIGITGVDSTNPDGVHENGTVFVAMATAEECFVRELHMGRYRSRSFLRRMSGNHAFDLMRRYLAGLPINAGATSKIF